MEKASSLAPIFALVWGFVIFLLIVANAVSMRHPGVSRKGALAAILACIPLALSAVLGFAVEGGKVHPALIGGAVILGFPCLVVAFILAILAVVEFRSRGFARGRKRAVAVLALCALLVVVSVLGALATFGKAVAKSRGTRALNGAKHEVADWNYRVTPPKGWQTMNPKAVNPMASAAFSRNNPQIVCMILSEQADAKVRMEAVAEVMKANLRGAGEAETVSEGPENVGDLEGVRIESKGRIGINSMYYVHWATQFKGALYQVIAWGPAHASETVRAEAAAIRNSFEIIDRDKSSILPAERAAQKHDGAEWSYLADFTGTEWGRTWPSRGEDCFASDWGIQSEDKSSALAVVPIWIGDESLDDERVAQAMMDRIGIPFSGDRIVERKDWSQAGWKGYDITATQDVSGQEFHYRIRVARKGGMAFLAGAWCNTFVRKDLAHLGAALDAVRLADAPAPAKPDLSKLDGNRKLAHALVWNDIGVGAAAAGDQATAAEWFRQAAELSPDDAVIAQNLADALMKAGKYDEVVKFVDSVAPKFAGNHVLSSKRAYARLAEKPEEGIEAYRRIFDAGWRNDEHFGVYTDALCEAGRPDEALAAIETYTAGRPGSIGARMKAGVLHFQKKFDESVTLLVAARKIYPNDADIHILLGDSLAAAGRHGESHAEWVGMIESGTDSAYIHRRKGVAELNLKRYRDAKQSFERAVAKAPEDPDLARLLDHASGMLGEGSNSIVKKLIDPVPVPDSLLADPKVADGDAYLEGFSAWYRYSVRAISYAKGKPLVTTDRTRVEVRDQRGVEMFSTMQVPFDPLGEELYVNTIEVKDLKGKTIAKGRVEDSWVVDESSDGAASQRKVLNVAVPALRPDTVIDFVVTRREFADAKAFSFQSHFFSKRLPVLKSVLHVRAPRGAIEWESTDGLPEPKRDGNELAWTVSKTPVYRWEPLQAPLERFMPMVWIGDADASWKTEAADYLGQIQEKLVAGDDVESEAGSIVKGLSSQEEKIAAIARHVQRCLTYKAIEFGKRARIPAKAADSLRNKYGDCKDHSVLLAKMLEAAGIPARLALVNSGAELRPGLPSLDQFDHMIVCIPGEQGNTFIDATAKLRDLRLGAPAWLAGKSALVLDPANPRLEKIPESRQDAGLVESVQEIKVGETDVEVVESLTLAGACAESLRSTLQSVEPANRTRTLMQSMVAEVPSVNLRTATAENVDDPTKPLELHLSYTVANRVRASGERRVVELPAVWERVYFAMRAENERWSPFRIAQPIRFTARATIAQPAGWRLQAPGNAEGKDAFFASSLSARTDAKALRIVSSLESIPGSHPSEKFAPYVQASQSAVSTVAPEIALVKSAP